jgi:hypothetical protein
MIYWWQEPFGGTPVRTRCVGGGDGLSKFSPCGSLFLDSERQFLRVDLVPFLFRRQP